MILTSLLLFPKNNTIQIQKRAAKKKIAQKYLNDYFSFSFSQNSTIDYYIKIDVFLLEYKPI